MEESSSSVLKALSTRLSRNYTSRGKTASNVGPSSNSASEMPCTARPLGVTSVHDCSENNAVGIYATDFHDVVSQNAQSGRLQVEEHYDCVSKDSRLHTEQACMEQAVTGAAFEWLANQLLGSCIDH